MRIERTICFKKGRIETKASLTLPYHSQPPTCAWAGSHSITSNVVPGLLVLALVAAGLPVAIGEGNFLTEQPRTIALTAPCEGSGSMVTKLMLGHLLEMTALVVNLGDNDEAHLGGWKVVLFLVVVSVLKFFLSALKVLRLFLRFSEVWGWWSSKMESKQNHEMSSALILVSFPCWRHREHESEQIQMIQVRYKKFKRLAVNMIWVVLDHEKTKDSTAFSDVRNLWTIPAECTYEINEQMNKWTNEQSTNQQINLYRRSRHDKWKLVEPSYALSANRVRWSVIVVLTRDFFVSLFLCFLVSFFSLVLIFASVCTCIYRIVNFLCVSCIKALISSLFIICEYCSHRMMCKNQLPYCVVLHSWVLLYFFLFRRRSGIV